MAQQGHTATLSSIWRNRRPAQDTQRFNVVRAGKERKALRLVEAPSADFHQLRHLPRQSVKAAGHVHEGVHRVRLRVTGVAQASEHVWFQAFARWVDNQYVRAFCFACS